jgi:hypothetical protein
MFCGTGFVQASELPSVVSFEGGGDANGSHDSYLDLDYGFESGPRLLFSLASNRSDSQNNSATRAIITKTSLIGFRTDPLEMVGAGADLEHWGEESTLTTDTLRAVLDINLESLSLSFRPEWRSLTFTTDCIALIIANCKPEVKVDSTGMAIDASYYTDGPWAFSLGYAKHDYDRKIEALGQYPVFELIFSAATLDLATGFEDYRNSVGVSYIYHDSLWSFTYLKSVSKVSGAASFVNVLRFSTKINESWRLRLRAGSQANEDKSERVGFAGAGLAYSW